MKSIIEERCLELANHIIENQSTVREAGKKFGISKSTVHKDIAYRLLKINALLAKQVRIILDKNKAERHLRGGLATKEKYKKDYQNLKKAVNSDSQINFKRN